MMSSLEATIKNNFRYIALIAAYISPIVLVIWFIARFGVNVPFWDEWFLVDLFEKIQSGTVSFMDFFAQSNEHRMVFPKIIISILAFSSGWNNKLEMYISLLLVLISFGLIYLISLESFHNSNHKNLFLFHLGNILSCAFFFTLLQQENWLMGLQIAWFIVNFCLISAIACLVLLKKQYYPVPIFWAALPCLIASFSSAHGLFTWLVVLPLIFFSSQSLRQRIIWCSLWLVAFSIVIFIYQIGYVKPESHPDIFFFLKEPIVALEYLLTLLGSIFGNTILPRFLVGFLLLSNFGIFNIFFLRHPYSLFSISMRPWLSLGWFSVLFAAATTVGRSGFGVELATASRYVTISILLLIALIQIWRILLSFENQKSLGSLLGAFLAGILLAIHLASLQQTVPYAKDAYLSKSEGKLCLELAKVLANSKTENAISSCLSNLFLHPNFILDRVDSLDNLGFFQFLTNEQITFEHDSNVLEGHVDSPSPATPYVISANQQNFTVSGWSALLNQPRLSTRIFLSVNDSPLFGATEMTRIPRPDVVEALGSSDFLFSGWQLDVNARFIPSGESLLQIWVYDPGSYRFLKMRDRLMLNKLVLLS